MLPFVLYCFFNFYLILFKFLFNSFAFDNPIVVYGVFSGCGSSTLTWALASLCCCLGGFTASTLDLAPGKVFLSQYWFLKGWRSWYFDSPVIICYIYCLCESLLLFISMKKGTGLVRLWRNCNLVHCWWECKTNGALLSMNKSVVIIQKSENLFAIWFSNPTFGYTSKRTENRVMKKYVYTRVYRIITHISQKMDST